MPARLSFTDPDTTDRLVASRRRRVYALATLYGLASGAIATVLLFAGLSYWAFALALLALAALIAVTSLVSKTRDTLGPVAAFSIAFALLLWPAELLVAFGLWGHWE